MLLKSRVDLGGISDHCPILLNIESEEHNPPAPFKFIFSWLKYDFIKLVEYNWTHLKYDESIPYMQQFSQNLKFLKRKIKNWSKSFK
jgi:hypothetical protein